MNVSDYIACGFRRIVCAVPDIRIADVDHNIGAITRLIDAYHDADIILFPELSVTGYSCADLFGQQFLLDDAIRGISNLCDYLFNLHMNGKSRPLVVVGAPVEYRNQLFNCAIFVYDGQIRGIVPKTYIPNYSEYYEERWFASGAEIPAGATVSLLDSYRNENIEKYIDFQTFQAAPIGTDLLFRFNGMTIGAEICEDLWVPQPPSGALAMAGADVILNLSASNETIGKHRYRRDLIRQQSARCRCIYAYASAGAGESSTDLAFSGYAAIAEDGAILVESTRFCDSTACTSADVDLHKITFDRRHTNTFSSPRRSADRQDFRIIDILADRMVSRLISDKNREIRLAGRSVERHPFVPSDPARRN